MKQFLLIFLAGFILVGCNDQATQMVSDPVVCATINKGMDMINKRAITDSIDTYYAALRGDSTLVDICINAGRVKMAYERVKDFDNVRVWEKIEKVDCVHAGL